MKKPAYTVLLRGTSVNIRYTYNRVSHAFPLSIKIELHQWDEKKMRVGFRYEGSTETNEKINRALTNLEHWSNTSIQAGIEPTVEIIKAKWAEHQAADKWHKERNERNKPKFEQLATDSRSEIEKLQARIRELEKIELRSLGKIGALPAASAEPDQPIRPLMIEMLYEYVEHKTGEPLGVKAKKTDNARKSTGTERQIRTWANTFLLFTKSKEARKANLNFNLQELDEKFYNTYAEYLMNPEGNDLYNNTFGTHVKKLKTFIRWVEIDRRMPVDPRYKRFKVLEEEKEIICFTKEEIDLLYQFKPETTRTHADANEYQKYIDFTVFSFLTGLRISDVFKAGGLRISGKYLIGKTTKTKNLFKVPLEIDNRILEILEKYNYDLKLFSPPEYNRTIKKVVAMFCKHHNLYQKPISITNYKLKQAVTTVDSFADLYTSHCNRRGFVSFAYSDLGYTVRDIMEIIGTRSEKEISKYLKLKADHLSEKLKKHRSSKSSAGL